MEASQLGACRAGERNGCGDSEISHRARTFVSGTCPPGGRLARRTAILRDCGNSSGLTFCAAVEFCVLVGGRFLQSSHTLVVVGGNRRAVYWSGRGNFSLRPWCLVLNRF